MGDGKELREHARVPFAVEVSLESEHNFYAGITDNISEGGIFVAMDDPPPTGTAVEFVLTLGGKEFRLKGIVRWVRSERMASEGVPVGCGIGWEVLPPDAHKVITGFIRSRDTLFYED